jgi:hypothetical protein
MNGRPRYRKHGLSVVLKAVATDEGSVVTTPRARRQRGQMPYDGGGPGSVRDLNEETLRDLDDVELFHGVDEIVTQFEELDPHAAGEALGALIQEFGERHCPDAVLAQFRRLLLARDPENDPAFELAAIRKGMARRAAVRVSGSSRG